MTNLISILYEITRYERETGESLPSSQEQIIKYEEKGGYFIHFSNVPRIGLYIVNKYNTPIGFYAYPLNRKKMADFAVDRPYAIIFKPKPEAKILDTKKYGEGDYKADVDELVDMGYSLKDIEEAARKARRPRPAGKIWNVTRVLSGSDKKDADDSITRGGGPTGKWSMLLKKLGYDGVNDDCFSIIHPSEPCQAVFFDTGKLDLIKVLDMKGTGIKFKSDLFEPEYKEFKQASDPKTSPKRLAMLTKSKNDQVRKSVAKNPSTPPETLRDLANPEIESNVDVRKLVYSNPNCPPDILTAAAESSDDRLGLDIVIANNPNTPLEALRKLAKSKNEWVRMKVAQNPSTPPETLRDLANPEIESIVAVREYVYSNPNCPPDVLTAAAESSDDGLGILIADNPNTPPETLRKLATKGYGDNNSWDNFWVRKSVVGNPNCPPDVLSNIAKNDKVIHVRQAAISNPSIPVETLVFLAKSTESQVRLSVAKNEKTPRETLIELSNDPAPSVLLAADRTLKKLGITEALIMQKVFNKLLGY